MKLRTKLFICALCIAVYSSQCAFISTEPTVEPPPKEALLSALFEADIKSIQEAYQAGLLTCYEVTEYYLQRISAYNESYNCFITLCEDALEQAQEIDLKMAKGEIDGLLLGIPVVIKDNIDYAGYHTTNGHEKWESPIADSNAEVVEYLLQEGAVIIGKTNMSTDAQDAHISDSDAVGETKNAYGLNLASGGSSGGSAVATSLNFAVAGLGTDTNSSLRLPAALNGCISLRATWDTLSSEGITHLNKWRDVPGVITRTVTDQAILLDVLSGGESSYAANLNSTVLKGLRLGIVEELTYVRSSSVDQEVVQMFDTAVQELESCGAEIVRISVPGVNYWIDDYDDSEAYRQNALGKLESIMEAENVSAVIFPTHLSAPQYSGRDENGVYHDPQDQPFLNNCRRLSPNLGIPEIAIPIGNHSRGASIGMEIAAGKNQEQLLLDIAYSYSLAYDHRQVPSGAPNLYSNSNDRSLHDLVNDYLLLLEQANIPEHSTDLQPEVSPTELPSSHTEHSESITDLTYPASAKEGTEPNKEPSLSSGELKMIVGLWFILTLTVLVILLRLAKKQGSTTHGNCKDRHPR